MTRSSRSSRVELLQTMSRLHQRTAIQLLIPTSLFCIALTILLITLVPTVYTLDSAEFTIVAHTLGFAHSPGYTLYTLVLHVFLQIPIGDPGYRANLFSALCLAATVPVLYSVGVRLLGGKLISAVVSLLWIWSYFVWSVGLFAEVYALQMLMLGVCIRVLLALNRYTNWRVTLVLGISVGLAIAAAPTTALFIPAVIVACLLARLGWIRRFLAGGIAIAIFTISLLYFPARFADQPTYNLLGTYNSSGEFLPIDLGTPAGVWWVISGKQFEPLFFSDGFIPSLDQLALTVELFLRNYTLLGVLLGLMGCWYWANRSRGTFTIWLVAFLTYTYFYTTYGAPDKQLMFGPGFLLWALAIGWGLQWITLNIYGPRGEEGLSSGRSWQRVPLLIIPVVVLLLNFPLLNLSQEYVVRERAQVAVSSLPANAFVFGRWFDIVPIEYLHFVEGKRPDLKLYNLFLFSPSDLQAFVSNAHLRGTPVVFVDSELQADDDLTVEWQWLFDGYEVDIQRLEITSARDVPLILLSLGARK